MRLCARAGYPNDLIVVSVEICGLGHFWQDATQRGYSVLWGLTIFQQTYEPLSLKEKQGLRSEAFLAELLESSAEIAGDTSGQSWSALQQPSSNRSYPLSLIHKYFERKNSGQALKSWLAHHSDEISIEKSQFLQSCQFLSNPLSANFFISLCTLPNMIRSYYEHIACQISSPVNHTEHCDLIKES